MFVFFLQVKLTSTAYVRTQAYNWISKTKKMRLQLTHLLKNRFYAFIQTSSPISTMIKQLFVYFLQKSGA